MTAYTSYTELASRRRGTTCQEMWVGYAETCQGGEVIHRKTSHGGEVMHGKRQAHFLERFRSGIR
eukprot:6731247-Prymnesium_polylepis.2